ncbi:MAG: recombinase family protein, partial [Acholeplasma sp.]|nr:recombinase family protein [Acholeplasma sp.]
DGKSNTEILEYVKSVGLKTVLGNDFVQNSQIIGILKDIKYTGQVVWGKTYRGKNNNDKVTFTNNGERPKYIIKNHHEAIIDMDTYDKVQELISVRKNDYPSTKNTTGWTNRFVYSLINEKYLHVKQKVKDNPKYDLLENEKARKPGSPRIYSRNATHVLRKATIALARNFSDLEAKFDKQIKEHFDTSHLDKQMEKIAEKIRRYKKEYFILKQKSELDEAEQSLIYELEETVIKLSVQYNKIEDETILFIDKLKRIKDIKKAISSIELPMDELPIDSIKEIFDVMVVADPENYVLLINASGKKLDIEALKNVTEIKPLHESVCKSKKFNLGQINWRIILM